jgi:hypothetical protein
MPRRRGSKIKVYVTMANNLLYGFETQQALVDDKGADAGITTYAGAAAVFFGANSPKPPRATWESTSGSESTYVSQAKVAALKKMNNVSVKSNTKYRALQVTGKTRTVYVPMTAGWNYAWNLSTAEIEYKDILGLQTPTSTNVQSLVWGVNSPKPPRASKKIGGSTVSTFINPAQTILDAASEAGWAISGVS